MQSKGMGLGRQTSKSERAAVIEKPKRKNARRTRPSPPATPRGIKRHEQIKAAAARVLERVGYSNLTLADVADEAGVNVSLLYHYFADKSDLTFAVLSDAVDSTVLFAREVTATEPFQRIYLANLQAAELYERNPGLMRCLLHFGEAQGEFFELFRRETAKHNRRVANDIARQMTDSPLSEPERLLLAHALGGMVDNFLFDRYVEQLPELVAVTPKPQDVAEFVSILWYRALYLKPPKSKNIKKFKRIAAAAGAGAGF